jgi:hypothetical protein
MDAKQAAARLQMPVGEAAVPCPWAEEAAATR